MPRLPVVLLVALSAISCAETISASLDGARDAGSTDSTGDHPVPDGQPNCGPEDPRCSDLIDPGAEVVWVDRDVPRDEIFALNEYSRIRYGVRLRPFRMGRFEVTNDAYRACVSSGRCSSWPMLAAPSQGGPPADYPTSQRYRLYPAMLNYAAALSVCEHLGGHLPTRAQFQFAGHGGSQQRYPWGDVAECAGNFDTIAFVEFGAEPDRLRCRSFSSVPLPEPVDSRPGAQGPFGTFNLLGNLGEYLALTAETPESIATLNRSGVFPYEMRRDRRDDDLVWVAGGHYAGVTELRAGLLPRMETTRTEGVANPRFGARCVWEASLP